MRRTSLFLPDDLTVRLRVEAARSGIKVAELIRRACDAMIPPISASAGELRKRIDREGFLHVFVLDARDGKLLVEPGSGDIGFFESTVQFWAPANLVTFAEAELISAPFKPPVKATPLGLRMNLAVSDEPEEKS